MGWSDAALREIFGAQDPAQARERMGSVLGRLRAAVLDAADLLEQVEKDALAFTAFPRRTGENAGAPTPWRGLTTRSAGAPTWWSSYPTTPPHYAWPGRCGSSRATNDWWPGATCRLSRPLYSSSRRAMRAASRWPRCRLLPHADELVTPLQST